MTEPTAERVLERMKGFDAGGHNTRPASTPESGVSAR